MIDIKYLGHSGFAVNVSSNMLIFDYIAGYEFAPDSKYRNTTFVSHAHADHFSRKVVEWYNAGNTALVTGDDVSAPGIQLAPGDSAIVNGMQVRAYGSTDQGVSFLVEVNGVRIFHAGDYNLWHWRQESMPEEIRDAERAFESVLDSLRNERIDVAFFPVDARMGEGYDEGALRFGRAMRPGVIIPMHWWEDVSVAERFVQAELPDGVNVIALTTPGESVSIDIGKSPRIG